MIKRAIITESLSSESHHARSARMTDKV